MQVANIKITRDLSTLPSEKLIKESSGQPIARTSTWKLTYKILSLIFNL